jgi:hypothetical protein
MEPYETRYPEQVTRVRWALTAGGWLRVQAAADAPDAAGYARVDLSPVQTRLGRVRAVVLELATDDAAALLEEFGPPPREDVADDVVREATASAQRVMGPRTGNPAGWDRLRDMRIVALARHAP